MRRSRSGWRAGPKPVPNVVEVDDASHGLPFTHADLVNRLLAEHLGLASAT